MNLKNLNRQARLDEEDEEDGVHVLKFEDLQSCVALSNLRHIFLSLFWDVDLTNSELVTLASAWPHLEGLLINAQRGWNTPGGITPNRVVQLLQTCRSLSCVALAIDTRGYIEFRESPVTLALTLAPTFSINVLDSTIEEESVLAMAAFLAGIAPCLNFGFTVIDENDHAKRWYDVYGRANGALRQRS